jgi:uncharacterized Rmd1/YagE family protein
MPDAATAATAATAAAVRRPVVGSPDYASPLASPVPPPTVTFHKQHLRSFSSAKYHPPWTPSLPENGGAVGGGGVELQQQQRQHNHQLRRLESGHELTVAGARTKARQRRNVGAFRRARQDHYDTWRGRVGAHVEHDEIDLKKLVGKIHETLPKGWELVDCYDVVRLWLPVNAGVRGEPQSKLDFLRSASVPGGGEEEDNGGAGEGGYDEGEGEIHASMPEVFVFGFGAVVFWNFPDETTERAWMGRHLVPHDVLGLGHNPESIDAARDEMGFRYGDIFRWRHDVVQLRTRDAGEKMAVSFAFAKSANLSVYEWRMEQAVRRNAHIPEALAEHGELHLRRREIDGEIGRLYLLNNAINLTTNMLDTPEVKSHCFDIGMHHFVSPRVNLLRITCVAL